MCTVRSPHAFLACAAAALSWAALLAAQEARPKLAGRWQLNEKESEDARAKFVWIEGPEGEGQRPRPKATPAPGRTPAAGRPAGTGSPPRGGFPAPEASPPQVVRIEGTLSPSIREFFEPPRTLTIAGDRSELTLDSGQGVVARLVLDGSEQKEDALVRIAKWQGSSLVVELRTEAGGRLLTRYNLMPGTRKIEVFSILSDRDRHGITLRRVYDEAPLP